MGWITGGTLAVAIAFFAPAQTGHMWYSLLFSGITVLLFLLFFLGRELPKLNSGKTRRGIAVTLGLTLFISVIASGMAYDVSKKQQSRLTDIRTTMDETVLRLEMNKIMLDLLRKRYHAPEAPSELTYEQLFRQHYDSLFAGGRYIGEELPQDKNSPILRLDTLAAERVELVGQSQIVKGRDKTFQNSNDNQGFLQLRATLTTEGLHYEMEN